MEQARHYVCKECSTPVPSGHKFCGRCGAVVPPQILDLRTDYFGAMQTPGKARLILLLVGLTSPDDGHIEVGVGQSDDVVVGEGRQEVMAELAACPGDEHLHRLTSPCLREAPPSFNGRHHHSLSRYQAIVTSSASPKLCSGFHPSCRTLVVSTE
jgi:hypothetical protein